MLSKLAITCYMLYTTAAFGMQKELPRSALPVYSNTTTQQDSSDQREKPILYLQLLPKDLWSLIVFHNTTPSFISLYKKGHVLYELLFLYFSDPLEIFDLDLLDTNGNGNTALHIISSKEFDSSDPENDRKHRTRFLEKALKAGIVIDVRNRFNETPLICSVKVNNLTNKIKNLWCTKALLGKQADGNLKDTSNASAFIYMHAFIVEAINRGYEGSEQEDKINKLIDEYYEIAGPLK